MFFAKLKHGLPKASRRSCDDIYNAIAAILPKSHPTNAATSSPTQAMGRTKIIPL
jgi:hypothetical protein